MSEEIKKNIISNRCEGVKLVGDGLALGAIAKKAKKEDPSVINATIGTLYDENAKFYKMPNVDKTIKSLSDDSFYTYANADGGKDYSDAAISWVFGKEKDYILSKMSAKSVATPGGTGAVNNGIYLSLDLGETILLPDLYWAPYKNMASVTKNKVINYNFIKDGKFNLDDFKDKANNIVLEQGKLVTILNDPCNNPTGYSLTLEEFKELIDYLNSLNCPVTVIYDIAYFDYFVGGRDEARLKFKYMTYANENILFNIAFSCSKTFSVYGMRLGAEIFLSKNSDVVSDAFSVASCLARCRWSNVNKAGISFLVKLNQDSALKEAVVKDIDDASEMLKKRIALFNSEAKECKLDAYPVSGGFFASIKCSDGNKLAEILKNEKKIYVLPYAKAIRIALCSIPMSEVKGLARKIKEVIF